MVIVDAGGGTVDISSYSRNQKENFEEIAPPQCSFVLIILKIANFDSLYARSPPWLCFCNHPCETVFREYVVVKLGPLYYRSTLSRLLERLTLSRGSGAYRPMF